MGEAEPTKVYQHSLHRGTLIQVHPTMETVSDADKALVLRRHQYTMWVRSGIATSEYGGMSVSDWKIHSERRPDFIIYTQLPLQVNTEDAMATVVEQLDRRTGTTGHEVVWRVL